MTLQELYLQIGGSYEHAQQIMKKDKMIQKYLLKLESSGVYAALQAAGESMEGRALFESGHALKGVAANLGLDALAQAASEVTEEFRPGSSRRHTDEEVKAMLARVSALYERTEAGIREFQAEQGL